MRDRQAAKERQEDARRGLRPVTWVGMECVDETIISVVVANKKKYTTAACADME